MSSTTVHSNNNQRCKTEITGMGIVFNTRENKYEIEVGQTLDKVLKDHIQEQGEMGISVESGYIQKTNDGSKLVTADGVKSMKNPRAYEVISKQREQRRERSGKAKQVEIDR